VTAAPGWTAETVAEFDALCQPLSNWGRWGAGDELGTLNLLTPERAAAAAAAVQHGEVISLGRAITTQPTPDNPLPLLHLMKASGEAAPALGGAHASDWLGLAYHGFAVTHIDAFSHQFWSGQMFNGHPADAVSTRAGAGHGSVDALAGGLVGRGVLLDAPRALDRAVGRDWLEPGEGLGPDDLDQLAAAHGVTISPGDLVLVRVGRDARALVHGRIDPITAGGAGLTAECLPWLRSHDIAVLGSDVQSDVMTPGGAPHPMPVHAGALAVLGLPLLDNLALEDLADACARHRRWEFLLTVAPLRLLRTTGSPVNPIALL
jgi:kynurenine formamidase